MAARGVESLAEIFFLWELKEGRLVVWNFNWEWPKGWSPFSGAISFYLNKGLWKEIVDLTKADA